MQHAGNIGGRVGGVKVSVNLIDQMALYDSLPVELRALVRDSFVLFDLVDFGRLIQSLRKGGFDMPRIVKYVASLIEREVIADTARCYGENHPQADRYAPPEFRMPLRSRRSRPLRFRARIR